MNSVRSDAQFWNDQNPDEIIPKRQRQIDSRSCHLFAAGRGNIDLTAPGTRLLAFCSNNPIAPTWAFWSMRSIPFEDACLLFLWWNSTYMLSQLIDIRTEVRGSRMWFSKKALQELPILNPDKLSRDSRSTLLKAFQEVSQLSFPSLMDQLGSSFEGRLIIDRVLSKIIGLEEFATDNDLQSLYASLYKKLSKLQTMMQRDSRS